MNDSLIYAQNLSKSFLPGVSVLNNLNFTLPQGEIIGLVGPDGAGKTTLLRLISSLLLPTTGSVQVLGCDTVSDGDKINSFMSYMPQRFGLYEDLTVYQNLDLYASLRGLERSKREEVFESLFQFTHLKPFINRIVGALSGGMKQKLSLACSMVEKPKILILDEPSVGVDPISRRELWKIVEDLCSEGVSIIWSTTYLAEAEKCSTILLLNKGEILYKGPPANFIEKVDKRVFLIKDQSSEKRDHLFSIENREDVVDALIQGGDIRVISKEPSFHEGTETQPHLEDAFIDALGGRAKGESKLSLAAPISSDGNEDLVVAENLVKKFGSFTAVGDVSFSVKKGEIFGLLGPNGAGKSTIFKMLCGLLKPTEGKAFVNGFNLQESPIIARSQLGYMAQKFSLYGNLTVQQNLEFFYHIYKASGDIEEKLKLFDLQDYKKFSADDLPLGYKQKLALAVATIHWPNILFLDEATSGMDPISRREFWSQMNGLVRKGKTILISTHFMDEAEYCDRIALIYRGIIIQLDSPTQLKELAKTETNQNPTLEDAFVKLIGEYDAAHP